MWQVIEACGRLMRRVAGRQVIEACRMWQVIEACGRQICEA